jgi:hypothetical protein
VPLAALPEGLGPEDGLDRLAQARGPIEDHQEALRIAQPPRHQRPQDGGRDRRMLGRGLHDPEEALRSCEGDPQRDEDRVLRDGRAVEPQGDEGIALQPPLATRPQRRRARPEDPTGARRGAQAEGRGDRLRAGRVPATGPALEDRADEPGVGGPRLLALLGGGQYSMDSPLPFWSCSISSDGALATRRQSRQSSIESRSVRRPRKALCWGGDTGE